MRSKVFRLVYKDLRTGKRENLLINIIAVNSLDNRALSFELLYIHLLIISCTQTNNDIQYHDHGNVPTAID